MNPLQLLLALCLAISLATTFVLAHHRRTKPTAIAFVVFALSAVAYALAFLQH